MARPENVLVEAAELVPHQSLTVERAGSGRALADRIAASESWLVGALLTTHGLLAWVARAPGILISQDDAWYILLSRSLRAFQYTDTFLTDAPPHRMYPPGFPIAIAVWSAIGGERFDWLVLLCLFSSVGALAFTYLTIRRLFGAGLALACLAALAVNPALVSRAGQVESEAPYMFAQSLAIWGLSVPGGGVPVALGVAAALATSLLRSIGVTMLIALAGWLLARGQWRLLTAMAVAGLLVTGGWMAWTAAGPEKLAGASYLADALGKAPDTGWGQAVVERLRAKTHYAADLYWLLPAPTIGGTILDNVIGSAVFGTCLIAGGITMLFRLPVAFAYLAVYGVLLLLWPVSVSRFLFPVLPLLVSFTLVGAGQLAKLIRLPDGLLPAALSAVLFAAGIVQVAEAARFNRSCTPGDMGPTPECLQPEEAGFFEAIRYVRDRTPADAVLLSGKQATVHLFTERRMSSLGRALSQPPAGFIDFLRQDGVSHILLLSAMRYGEGRPSWTAPALGDLVQQHCASLEVERVFSANTLLLRLPPPGGASPATAGSCDAVAAYVTLARSGRVAASP